jgi:hypothetical protein
VVRRQGARPHRESTRRTDYDEARAILREKLAAVSRGELVVWNTGSITVASLLTDLENDYKANRQDLPGANVQRLRDYFGKSRAVDVTTADLRAYNQAQREGQERREAQSRAQSGTVSRI